MTMAALPLLFLKTFWSGIPKIVKQALVWVVIALIALALVKIGYDKFKDNEIKKLQEVVKEVVEENKHLADVNKEKDEAHKKDNALIVEVIDKKEELQEKAVTIEDNKKQKLETLKKKTEINLNKASKIKDPVKQKQKKQEIVDKDIEETSTIIITSIWQTYCQATGQPMPLDSLALCK